MTHLQAKPIRDGDPIAIRRDAAIPFLTRDRAAAVRDQGPFAGGAPAYAEGVSGFEGSSAGIPRWLTARTLDMIEKAVIATFFLMFCIRIVPHIDDQRLANLVVFISECLITGFALFHRPTEKISRIPSDWLLAISVSFMPTLIAPMEESSQFPVAISVGLMTFGFLLATTAKLFLARSFGVVPANRGVCACGPYRIVRHPVYAGYFITHIGFLSAYPAAWNFMLYGIVGALQIKRILAEEALLSQDLAYQDYRRLVPFRLLPGLF